MECDRELAAIASQLHAIAQAIQKICEKNSSFLPPPLSFSKRSEFNVKDVLEGSDDVSTFPSQSEKDTDKCTSEVLPVNLQEGSTDFSVYPLRLSIPPRRRSSQRKSPLSQSPQLQKISPLGQPPQSQFPEADLMNALVPKINLKVQGTPPENTGPKSSPDDQVLRLESVEDMSRFSTGGNKSWRGKIPDAQREVPKSFREMILTPLEVPKSFREKILTPLEMFTNRVPASSRKYNRDFSKTMDDPVSNQISRRYNKSLSRAVDDAVTNPILNRTRRYSSGEILMGVSSIAEKRQQRSSLTEFSHEVELLTKKRSVSEILQERRQLGIVSVESSFRQNWDFIVTVAVIYIAITVPVRLGFNVASSTPWTVLDFLFDILFISDIFLNFRTSFIDDRTKEEVCNPKIIGRRYIHGFFFVDVVSSVPVSCISYFCHTTATYSFLKLFRLSKLFRLIKASTAFIQLESHADNPAMYRLAKVSVLFILTTHFMACLYWFIHSLDGTVVQGSVTTQYLYALFVAVGFAGGAGPGDAKTSIDYFFETLYLLVGIIINATLIGSAATILAQLDVTAVEKKKQVDSIAEFMRKYNVPNSIQQRVRGFIEYSWELGHSSYYDQLLSQLPPKLKLELNVVLKKDFLLHCPLIKTLPPQGQITLIQQLQKQIVLPNDLVLKQGEVADCMYFITRGSVSAFHKIGNHDQYITTLVEGSFFGEVGLLEESGKRTATIVAETYAELQRLSKKDFKTMFSTFEEFRAALESLAERRLNTLKTTVLSADAWKDGKDSDGAILSLNQLAIRSRKESVHNCSPNIGPGSVRRTSTVKKLKETIKLQAERRMSAKIFVESTKSSTKDSSLDDKYSEKAKHLPTENQPSQLYDQILGNHVQVSHSMARALQQPVRRESMDFSSARQFLSNPDPNQLSRTGY